MVGRVQVRPLDTLDLLYRFRLDKDDLTARRSEMLARIGPPALNLDLSYFFINNDNSTDEFGSREEVTFGIASRLNENWSVGFRHRRDIEEDRALLSSISRSEEHTSELQSLMRISYDVFCLKKTKLTYKKH